MTKAFILIAALLFCAITVQSEPVKEKKKPLSYVSDVRFSGNKAISADELRLIIGTTKQSSFLGLGLFGGVHKPFSSEEFARDIALIKKLYTYKGYFGTEVDTVISRRNSGKTVNINIRIHENAPSRIDSLTYRGLEKIPDDLSKKYFSKQLLKRNDIFSVEKLIEERDRSISFFKENGFAFFHEDSIRIKVDTVGTHAGIHFNMQLPARLTYGPVRVVVQQREKTNSTKPLRKKIFSKEKISGEIIGKQKISTKLITSSIAFRPGNVTQQSLEQRTLQNFGATNIFSSMNIASDSVRAGEVYTTINLETAPKHQIEPKIVLDNRYGPLFLGTSFAYENKNLFGAGEQFRTATEYGRQLSSDNRALAHLSYSQYETIIPYEFNIKSSLILPTVKKAGNAYTVTAEYSETKQPVLLSSRSGLIRTTYSARLNPSTRINFDFFELEWVSKDSLNGFKQLFKTDLADNIGINPANEVAVNTAIDSLMSTHINQSFRLRLNATNRHRALPERAIWNLDMLLEESGSLASLIDTYLDTKPSPGFTENDPQIFGTTYSQYLKVETGLSYEKIVSPHSQLAAKGRIGWMKPYGKAESTPEERRFYAGGSNSMRGWLFNTLGPGNSQSKAASNFGADIKLELNMEYRLKFFKLFNQPSGVTFFTDVGNIWDRTGQYALTMNSLTKDFALDSGVGLRIGSPIGPFRFDFAYKLRDPAEEHPWQFSTWDIRNVTFNFGIGEAF